MTVSVIGNLIKAEFTGTASGGTDVNVPGLEVGDFILSSSYHNGSGRYLNTTIFDAKVTTANYIRQNAGDTSDFVLFLIRQ